MKELTKLIYKEYSGTSGCLRQGGGFLYLKTWKIGKHNKNGIKNIS